MHADKFISSTSILFCFFLINAIGTATYAHVDLTNPKGGEVYAFDDTLSIEWEEVVQHDTKHWVLEYSLDSGSSWTTIDTVKYEKRSYNWGIPNTESSKVQVRITQVNIDYTDFSDKSDDFTITQNTMTGISDNHHLPRNVKLHSNYPNPFNPTTKIKFKLPESRKVNLTVYNSVGRIITTIADQKMTAGSHTVTFDGSGLSSGLYIYQIKAGEFTDSKTMMLVR